MRFGNKFAVKIANFFVNDLPDLKSREGVDISVIPDSFLVDVFDCYVNGKLVYDAVFVVIKEYSSKNNNVATIINMRGLKSLTKKEAQKIISNIVATNKTRPLGAVMGIVMKELKGKVEGSLIAELVKNCYDA